MEALTEVPAQIMARRTAEPVPAMTAVLTVEPMAVKATMGVLTEEPAQTAAPTVAPKAPRTAEPPPEPTTAAQTVEPMVARTAERTAEPMVGPMVGPTVEPTVALVGRSERGRSGSPRDDRPSGRSSRAEPVRGDNPRGVRRLHPERAGEVGAGNQGQRRAGGLNSLTRP